MDKNKGIYYYDAGLSLRHDNTFDGFLVVGPVKVFDSYSLVGKGLITGEDYNVLLHTLHMRKFNTVKEYLDKILDSIEKPFGGQKMYMWIAKSSKTSFHEGKIDKKKKENILKFINQSHISFHFKTGLSLYRWKPKSSETIKRYLKNYIVPKILNSSNPTIYVGSFSSRYRDFMSLYISHKFGWI